MKSQHRHCPTCGKTMPDFEAIEEEYRDEIRQAARLAREQSV